MSNTIRHVSSELLVFDWRHICKSSKIEEEKSLRKEPGWRLNPGPSPLLGQMLLLTELLKLLRRGAPVGKLYIATNSASSTYK